MFTGIIEGLGKIISINFFSNDCRFNIKPLFKVATWEEGESVSVNGVCLSVEKYSGNEFQVYASRETLALTNLSFLRMGDKVNLERAVMAGQRLGGHLVSGHIDCIATIKNICQSGFSKIFTVNYPEKFSSEIIKKGSIALDGISLTINECNRNSFTVNIIPDSLKRTNISMWGIGSKINMETDLIGKYVVSILSKRNVEANSSCSQAGLTMNVLLKNGFI